jgi:hypothetical protein
VYPARGSPKKIGPPEVEADEGPVENGLLMKGDVGEEVNCVDEGGRVSHERVRRQDCRMIEKEVGASGSWVEV